MSKSKKKIPAVQLVVQAGMIPENILKQLVAWKLLPEAVETQHGAQRISLESGWDSVEEFVGNLEEVIDAEAMEIRETTLEPPSAGYHIIRVDVGGKGLEGPLTVMSDGLGRLYLPKEFAKKKIVSVIYGDGFIRKVRKVDTRYQGDEVIFLVCEV